MYTWNVRRLKAELAASRVSDTESLKYLLATIAGMSIVLALDSWQPVEPTPATLVVSAAELAIALFGTYAAYAANGGAQGVDFLSRYVALNWVVGVRMMVGLVIFFIVAFVFVAIGDPEALDDPAYSLPGEDAIIVLWIALFYWRIAAHMRGLRAEPSAVKASARIDAG